jgi:hypothetical protein
MYPLINGVSYSYADVIVNLMGVTPAGITAVDYGDEQKKEDQKGAGRYPVARTYGEKTANASITLDSLEVEALQDTIPDGDITSLPPFTIVVCFLNSAGLLKTHKLMNAEFIKNHRAAKSGDMSIPVELPLIVSHINWKA